MSDPKTTQKCRCCDGTGIKRFGEIQVSLLATMPDYPNCPVCKGSGVAIGSKSDE